MLRTELVRGGLLRCAGGGTPPEPAGEDACAAHACGGTNGVVLGNTRCWLPLVCAALVAGCAHYKPQPVGFQLSYEGIPMEVYWEFQTSPWRYVVSAATNNPGKYDLWIELKAREREVVIGNWKAVE